MTLGYFWFSRIQFTGIPVVFLYLQGQFVNMTLHRPSLSGALSIVGELEETRTVPQRSTVLIPVVWVGSLGIVLRSNY